MLLTFILWIVQQLPSPSIDADHVVNVSIGLGSGAIAIAGKILWDISRGKPSYSKCRAEPCKADPNVSEKICAELRSQTAQLVNISTALNDQNSSLNQLLVNSEVSKQLRIEREHRL